MADADLAIRGGTLVTGSGMVRLDLNVRGGRIVHIGDRGGRASTEVDASGLLVLPGMVDTHVHLMDPGDPSREDFPTGTAAAAARGVTTIVEHTHGCPVRTTAGLRDKRAYLQGRANVDFGLAAHIWPEHVDEIPRLYSAGVVFFKAFTCTTHGVPGLDTARLLSALRRLSSVNAPALVHCEDERITEEAERALRAAGRADNGVIPQWRCREAELVATQTTLLLAGLTGARVTIAHVSSAMVAELVTEARAKGADVVAEACPQYFLLREHEVLELGGLRKFTPPARSRSTAEEGAMWDLLRRGVLHHVSTDHAPATREQKTSGDIWSVHFGLPGLDTTLPLLLDAAARGRLGYEDVVRVYAERPAARYGLAPRKGRLAVGADADVVLVDPRSDWTVRDEDVISKAGWSPYAGRRLQGRVVATFLRGREVARDGTCHGERGGEFIPGAGASGSQAADQR